MMELNKHQLSAYDERPDPKKPGQQGVLFRKEAPARGTPDERRGMRENKWGDPYDIREQKGRIPGIYGDLYHGTAARLKPGSLITPGKPANFEGYNNGRGFTHDVNHEHVFATSEMGLAHKFSRVAAEKRGQRNNTGYARSYVYHVQPTGPMQSDSEEREGHLGDEYSGHGGEAYQSKYPLRVLSRVQFPAHQEAYRSYMEDEMGLSPGDYEWAPKEKEGW